MVVEGLYFSLKYSIRSASYDHSVIIPRPGRKCHHLTLFDTFEPKPNAQRFFRSTKRHVPLSLPISACLFLYTLLRPTPTNPLPLRLPPLRLMAMPRAGTFAQLIFLLLALYCAVDPFRHSAISNFPDFEAFAVDMPPWSEVPTQRDTQNLLQNSEIKFLNQVQGPESITFDPLGRGPYTGVADGRVVFWNGQSWEDFAYTSPNR